VNSAASRLVFDCVEYEKDKPIKKILKYNVGSLSPIPASVLKNTEPKEKLELQHFSERLQEE
jgi:activator of S phase kinase